MKFFSSCFFQISAPINGKESQGTETGTVKFITGRNEVVAKVMFLHVSVILLTGGVSGEPPPGPRRTPPRTRQTPPWDQGEPPPGPGRPTPPQDQGDPPGPGRPTQDQGEPPPRPGRPPPDQGDPPAPGRPRPPPAGKNSSIWSMSGRYASYWNAFLFYSVIEVKFSQCRGFFKLLPLRRQCPT